MDFGFNENDFQKAKDIIYFIGYAQDLAWSKEEGVLQKDVQVDKKLLDYLKQGVLKQDNSRYKNFPIYRLDTQANIIFNELVSDFKNSKVINSFLEKINLLNLKYLTLTFNDKIRTLEDLYINPIFNSYLKDSKQSEQIKVNFSELKKKLINLVKKDNLFFKVTDFNSKRISETRTYLFPDITSYFNELILPFKDKFNETLDFLNTLFPKLDDSIQDPSNREVLQDYIEYIRTLVNEKLESEKITTPFKEDLKCYFKIINNEKFKSVLSEEIQRFIIKLDHYYLPNLKEEKTVSSEPKEDPYIGNEKFIFISYSHKDQDIVYPLISRLQKEGFKIWYDKEISTGDNWLKIIAEKIEKCHVFLAFISPNAIALKEGEKETIVMKEIKYAIYDEKKEHVFPIILKNMVIPKDLKLLLGTINFKEKFNQKDKDFHKDLIDNIKLTFN